MILCLGKTNGTSFELYAILGEIYGSGMPLCFLLLWLEGHCEKGGKERLISAFLRHICEQWDIHPIITLSDKDTSEIKAMRSQFPYAKH
jgi:hypothetical protein